MGTSSNVIGATFDIYAGEKITRLSNKDLCFLANHFRRSLFWHK